MERLNIRFIYLLPPKAFLQTATDQKGGKNIVEFVRLVFCWAKGLPQ